MKLTIDNYIKYKYNARIYVANPYKNFSSGINFGGFNCSQEDFKIKTIYGTPCPCCGKKMLQQSQINSAVNSIYKKRGIELSVALREYDDIYRPIEKGVVNIIAKIAYENPRADLAQTVQIGNAQTMAKLEDKQSAILINLMRASSFLSTQEDIKKYKKFINENLELIKSKDKDKYFKRKTFISQFNKLVSTFKLHPSKEKRFKNATQIIQNLPSSTSDVNAFFAKYSRKDSQEIAQRLFLPSLATTEHIQPQSKNGEDNTANYLAECGDCNSKRGNTNFSQWIKGKPKIKNNLQKYLNYVENSLQKLGSDFSQYKDYTLDIINTINQQTNGGILLNKPTTTEEEKETQQEEDFIIPSYRRIEYLYQQINRTTEKIEEIETKKAELLKSQEYQKYKQYKSFITIIGDLQAAKKIVSKHYHASKRVIQAQQESGEIKEKSLSRFRMLEEKLNGYTIELDAQKSLYAAFLEEFQTPQDLEKKLNDYKGLLSKLNGLDFEINQIKTAKNVIFSLSEQQKEMENRLAQKQMELEDYLQADTDNPESKSAIESYKTLLRKIQIIDSINPKIFLRFFKESNYISQSFILDEAKKSINLQIEDALKNPAVKHYSIIEEIKELQDKISEITCQIDSLKEKINKLDELNKKKTMLLGEKTNEDILNEIENLQEKIKRYKEYEYYEDSEEKIKTLKDFIEQCYREIEEISEKEKPAEYKNKSEEEKTKKTKDVTDKNNNQDVLRKIAILKRKLIKLEIYTPELSTYNKESEIKERDMLKNILNEINKINKEISSLQDEIAQLENSISHYRFYIYSNFNVETSEQTIEKLQQKISLIKKQILLLEAKKEALTNGEDIKIIRKKLAKKARIISNIERKEKIESLNQSIKELEDTLNNPPS